jgi:hypothetical protein
MIALQLSSEPLTRLQAQAAKLGHAEDAGLVAGRAVRQLLVDYFTELDASRANKMGGARSHFYAKVAKSTSNPQPAGGGTVVIEINQVGFAQRWLGGEILPGKGMSSSSGSPTKYLAIPARAEAYDKAPGEMPDLEFVPLGRNRGMLVQCLQVQIIRGKRKGEWRDETVGGLVMFWLVDHVEQDGDPSVMPTEWLMLERATSATQGYVTRLLATH